MQALISGFTFVRHGLTLGYPIKESIESLEPLCDQIVITVGFDHPDLQKDDGTYQYLRDHFTHKKFLFQRSYWDPNMKKEGLIISQQSNYSLRECRGKYCQYLQADEVLHEDDLGKIHNAVLDLEKNPKIEGLTYDFLHFYSSPELIQQSSSTYRREVRLIRNKMGAKSWKDGQGFRSKDEKRLLCLKSDARIFHYGQAFKEELLAEKNKVLQELFPETQGKFPQSYAHIWGLKAFKDSHPKLMQSWIERNKNGLDILKQSPQHEARNIPYILADFIEGLTGMRPTEYKNYKLL